jgi:23S rRNA (guanosine2251-2'-O)-methyltransferase
MKKTLFLIAHNIRSAHNVGAIFRTAEGAGVEKIFLTGYTPGPYDPSSHLALTAAQKELAKTALGAQEIVPWEKRKSLPILIGELKKENISLVALELAARSKNLFQHSSSGRAALIVGNEVKGIDRRILKMADEVLFIPMRGKKESLNVSVAAGIAMYQLLR